MIPEPCHPPCEMSAHKRSRRAFWAVLVCGCITLMGMQVTRPAQDKADKTQPRGSLPFAVALEPLSDAQINRIKQLEMRYDDLGVTIRFENEVELAAARAMGMNLRTFRARRPIDRFMDIRQLGDPLLLDDVKIIGDPKVMGEFRRSVHPVILAGCAASGCHGGAGIDGAMGEAMGGVVGGLSLMQQSANEQAAYTNFYRLATYRAIEKNVATGAAVQPGDAIGGSGPKAASAWVMIDRVNPPRSLLLQMGRVRGAAEFSHPDVPGYEPVFFSDKDQRYENVLRWIEQTLSPVQPLYEKMMPVSSSPETATTPATAQSTPAK